MSDASTKYYGKYRATVFNNTDPEQRGRLQAIVPDVLGQVPSSWAMPCLPVAGKGSGSYLLPEVGAGIWIEFEQGDSNYPIWAGCFWGAFAELPEQGMRSVPSVPNIVFQTNGRNSLTIYGDPVQGITICAGPVDVPTSPRLTITPTEITITNSQATIRLAGTTVDINNGALTIM